MDLYITEKPSQIEALELGLRDNGLYKEGGETKIFPFAGHIMRLKTFNEYDPYYAQYWNKLVEENSIPFFPKKFEKVVSETAKNKYKTNYKKIFKEVSVLIKKADRIILAPDPDVEGATLVMEVIEACNATSKVVGMINMNKLDRASMKKEVSIINKINYKALFDAGEARSIFDQMFGFNLSILATEYLFGGQTLEIGGVSLPIIRMIVERDLLFEAHKKVPYWTVKATAKKDGKEFKVYFTVDSKRQIKNNATAEDIALKMDLENRFIITKFNDALIKTEKPPKPFDHTGLQAEGVKKLKINITQVKDAAQHNYTEKIQSYPRTDSNYYSSGEFLESPRILKALSTIDEKYKTMLRNIQNPLVKRTEIFNDAKLTGEPHTALSPLSEVNKTKYGALNNIQKDVFDLVAKRYIIQFAKDYKYLRVSGSAHYSPSAHIEVHFDENISQELGFKKITQDEVNETRTIPSLEINDTIEIIPDSIKIEKEFTAPKPRFTEATLLEAMQKIHLFFDDPQIKATLKDKGIGTPATREEHISKIIRQNYIEKTSGKLISTKKARFLIKSMPPSISSPLLRAKLENGLKEIINGKITKEKYIKEICQIVKQICDMIKKTGKFEKRENKSAEPTIYKCPLCAATILKSEKIFKCEKSVYKNKKRSGCKFTIFRNQEKAINRILDEDDLILLLEKKEVIGSNKNKIAYNETKSGFIEYINDNSSSSSGSSTFTPVAHSNGIKEYEKNYIKDSKSIFKTFRNREITLLEAEKLFDGEKILLKLKSKGGNFYNVNAFYSKKDKKLDCTLAKKSTIKI